MDDEIRNWIATGTVTKIGVLFFFEKMTRAEAEQAIREYRFVFYEDAGADISDLTIDANTLEPNE